MKTRSNKHDFYIHFKLNCLITSHNIESLGQKKHMTLNQNVITKKINN